MTGEEFVHKSMVHLQLYEESERLSSTVAEQATLAGELRLAADRLAHAPQPSTDADFGVAHADVWYEHALRVYSALSEAHDAMKKAGAEPIDLGLAPPQTISGSTVVPEMGRGRRQERAGQERQARYRRRQRR